MHDYLAWTEDPLFVLEEHVTHVSSAVQIIRFRFITLQLWHILKTFHQFQYT